MTAAFPQDLAAQHGFYKKGLIMIRPFFFYQYIMDIFLILSLDDLLKRSLAIITDK